MYALLVLPWATPLMDTARLLALMVFKLFPPLNYISVLKGIFHFDIRGKLVCKWLIGAITGSF